MGSLEGDLGSLECKKKAHIVCIPPPYQGHINPMLKVAKLLHSRGFRITFVNTEFHHQKILKSRGPDSLKGLPDFQFETIPDGLPPCDPDSIQDQVALSICINATMSDSVRNLIAKLKSDGAPQVTCIIADGIMTSPLEPAQQLGIPTVLMWSINAMFFMCSLQCGKRLPLKDNSDLEIVIDFIPGLRDVRVKDLPSTFLDVEHIQNEYIATQLGRASMASAIIMNTFDALEHEALEAMKPLLPPIYPIGPLHLIAKEATELVSIGSNLWKEDDQCLKWLESKQPNSVIYVSFGSLIELTPEELTEFAWGLANSNHNFLWVLRPGIVMGDEPAAYWPPEFIKETADRGFISNWCPQEQVVTHPSIGGLLTHCGWNTLLDAFSNGVPFLCWPFNVDQLINCRYACVHWENAMEIERPVKRDQLERLVREMLDGEKGKLMKKKAMEWMKITHETAKPGGSSYLNLDRFIKEVLLQKTLK